MCSMVSLKSVSILMLQTKQLSSIIRAWILVCSLEQVRRGHSLLSKWVAFSLYCCYCRVAELLGGKGAGKRGRFQGKATKMSRRAEVQALLQEFISHRSPEA